MIDFTDLNTYWPIATSVLTTTLSQGGLKGPMQSLSHLWYAKFGYKAEQAAKLAELKNSIFYEQAAKSFQTQNEFLADTDSEIAKIKPENLTHPISYIAGPAIEQSTHYIDEPELRSMFAKLIASSMDNSKTTKIHSAFTQIIKELTPLDAKLLNFFPIERVTPIAKIQLYTLDKKGVINMYNHILKIKHPISDTLMYAASIDNLSRLGLIHVDYDNYLIKKDAYNWVDEKPEYIRATSSIDNEKYSEVLVTKGAISFTDFGKNFILTCVH